MLHNKKNFINRVSRLMVNDVIINITLNSQLEYWIGQKKSVGLLIYYAYKSKISHGKVAPAGEGYPYFRGFTLNSFNPYSLVAFWTYGSRNGLGMKWSTRVRDIWGWGLGANRINLPRHKSILRKIRILQRKFKFYITTLLQTFAETLQIIEMSTLSQQGERSNAHVYSTD